jgi:hypothetical protein
MPMIAAALSLSLVVVAFGQPITEDRPTILLVSAAVPFASSGIAPRPSPPARSSNSIASPATRSGPDSKESGVLSDAVVLLLGTLLSLYVTVVFERQKRFGDLLRDVGRTRQHFEGYPVSPGPKDLEHAHTQTVNFWRFLENKEWGLAADGHHQASARINRLKAFFFRAAACIEKMQSGDTKGLPVDQYLMEFQSEYQRIYDGEFRQYESTIHPTMWALIRPFPHPVLPKSLTAVGVNDFDTLL